MNPENENKNLYGMKFTIPKESIPDFVNSLHKLQETFIESAVEKSGYREANEAIKRIMEMR